MNTGTGSSRSRIKGDHKISHAFRLDMKRYRFLRRSILPVTLVLLVCSTPTWVGAQPSDSLLARIDSQQSAGAYHRVHEQLTALTEQYPSSVELLWRLSRVEVDLGEDRAAREDQERHYRESLGYAREAIAADSTSSNAWMSEAIAAGRVALISDTRRKIELSRLVKNSVDRAIELDPSNDIAYHVRGRWHYEVSSLGFFTNAIVRVVYGGLPDASYEQAAEDLRRALELKNWMGHRLELGRTYIALDKEEAAREQLQEVLTMDNPYDADTEEYRRDARELLAAID